MVLPDRTYRARNRSGEDPVLENVVNSSYSVHRRSNILGLVPRKYQGGDVPLLSVLVCPETDGPHGTDSEPPDRVGSRIRRHLRATDSTKRVKHTRNRGPTYEDIRPNTFRRPSNQIRLGDRRPKHVSKVGLDPWMVQTFIIFNRSTNLGRVS